MEDDGFSVVESAYDELAELTTGIKSLGDIVSGFELEAKNDRFLRANQLQMERIAQLLTRANGERCADEHSHILHGQIVAYRVMEKLTVVSPASVLYAQMSEFYLTTRHQAYINLGWPPKSADSVNVEISRIMNQLLENDLAFAAIDQDELDFLESYYKPDALMRGSEAINPADEAFTLGYRLVRTLDAWYLRNENTKTRKDLGARSIRAAEVLDAVEERPVTPQETLEHLLEVVGDMSLDTQAVDGLEPCDDTLQRLVDLYHHHVRSIDTRKSSPYEVEGYEATLAEGLTADFLAQHDLKIRDRITVIGDYSLTVFDKHGEVQFVWPVDRSATLRAIVADVDVTRGIKHADSRKLVAKSPMIKHLSKPKQLDHFVPGIVLDNASITNVGGIMHVFDQHEVVLLRIDSTDMRLWRDPLA